MRQILDEKEKDMGQLLGRVEQVVLHNQQALGSLLDGLSQPDSCLESLIHFYYYRKEREQEWNSSILHINELTRSICEGRAIRAHLNPETLPRIKALVSSTITLSPESLPLPVFDIPILTQARRVFLPADGCCNSNCKPCC